MVGAIAYDGLTIRCGKRPKLRQRTVLRDPNRDRRHAKDRSGLFG
jgi:hypothetical protein